MAKTVNRRYYSKKKGMWIEKQYTYNKTYKQRRSAKGLTFIGKGGRLYKENIDKFLSQRDEFGDRIFSKSEENDIRAWIRDEYENIERRKNYRSGKGYRPLTATSVTAHLTQDKLDRMLTNAGYTLQEAADEMGVTEAQLRKGKWNGDEVTVNGTRFKLNFGYYGGIFEEIK